MAVAPGDLTGLRSLSGGGRVLRFRCALSLDDENGCALSLRCIVDPAYADDRPGRVTLSVMGATADDSIWESKE